MNFLRSRIIEIGLTSRKVAGRNATLRFATDQQLTLWVTTIACIASALLVLLDLWHNRNLFDPEGITYLDMADAYRRGDWRAALVGNWSPLFPALLAVMMFLFNPSAQWEFTAVHALNYFIYLVVLASFTAFMKEFLRAKDDDHERVPDWAWLALGYALFTWSIIKLIPPHQPQPDLLVCAFVYLLFAMLSRLRAEILTWRGSLAFGIFLGLGYLTKGIMFPMAFVFIGVALVLAGRSAHKRYKILVAFSVFLLVSLPYVVALSNANGRWMFSDAGRLNYVWELAQVKRWVHWQGEEGSHGIPLHPTRRIHENPPIYEFGTPFKVTYPPWYNPSYWYEGVVPTIDLRAHRSVIVRNFKVLLAFLGSATGPMVEKFRIWGGLEKSLEWTIGPLFTVFCILLFATFRRVMTVKTLTGQWFLLAPIVAVFAAYGLLHFEGRYIAAYVVVLWLVLFRSVAICHTAESKRILTAAVGGAALFVALSFLSGTAQAMWQAARHFVDHDNEVSLFQSGYPNWQVAKYLHNKGVRAGDPVGAVGWTLSGYWARMARVRVIAEIPAEGAAAFWSSDASSRATVMSLFRDVGAKAVVAKVGFINAHQLHEWDLQGLPGKLWPLPNSQTVSVDSPNSEPAGWHHIPDTDYYVYVL